MHNLETGIALKRGVAGGLWGGGRCCWSGGFGGFGGFWGAALAPMDRMDRMDSVRLPLSPSSKWGPTSGCPVQGRGKRQYGPRGRDLTSSHTFTTKPHAAYTRISHATHTQLTRN